MHHLLYFFLAGMAFVLFILTVLTKNFTLSLASLVTNFGAAYASLAVEYTAYLYDASTRDVITYVDTIGDIAVAAIFLLFGIASVVYAFFLPFGGEKELKI